MDPVHWDLILKNLSKLLEQTECTDSFLALFRTKGILSLEDIELIKVTGRNETRMHKSSRLYDIIQGRTGSFEVLVEALKETNQTGALALLRGTQQRSQSNVDRNKPKRFTRSPNYIKDFKNSPNKTVLIVTSKDCRITCDRICETCVDCRYFSFDEFVNYLSQQRLSNSGIMGIPVINCGNKVISMLNFLNDEKVVVVCNDDVVDPSNTQHYKVTDTIVWNDLSAFTRNQILEAISHSSALGLQSSECLTQLEKIENVVLLQLLKGDIPSVESLFKNSIPEQIKHYIPRTLITRNVILSEIFLMDGPDAFFVAGIERHELSELAASRTETSSDIINIGLESSIKFVVLEDVEHFERIAETVNNRPLHYLYKQNGKLLWIKSIGSIHAIQQNVDFNNQNMLHENEFVQNITDTSIYTNDLVCISASPGMGKSVLLAQIARKFQEIRKPSSVGFIAASKMVAETKKFKNSSNFEQHVLNFLSNRLCQNQLGVAYFLKNKNQLSNLFLDDFDEINSNDNEFTYKLLRALKGIFKTTRLWIATRPHMLIQLEKPFSILGYGIQPFSEQEQINLLQSFWSKSSVEEADLKLASRLTYFAKECLRCIKSKIHCVEESDTDIAGIPLQCQLIGEIFKKEARYFGKTNGAPLPKFHLKSTADLYQELVMKKFSAFFKRYNRNNVSKQDLNSAHIYHAISLLFPDYHKKLAKELPPQNLSLQDILDAGIIETSQNDETIRFIHKTLAEHFLSEFLLEFFSTLNKRRSLICCLTRKLHWEHKLLFSHILETKPVSLRVINTRGTTNLPLIKTHEFRHNVICDFLNSNLDNYKHQHFEILDKNVSLPRFKELAEACAYGSYDNIFMKLIYPASLQPNFHSLYSDQFLVICTKRAGLKTASAAYQNASKIRGISIQDMRFRGISLLHFAVVRGQYSLIEHLIGIEGFSHSIVNNPDDFSSLISDLVYDSYTLDSRSVGEKLDMIKYLARINPNLLVSRNPRGDLLFVSSNINVDIAKQLFTLIKGEYRLTDILKYLHSSLKIYTSENYYDILSYMLVENGINYVSELCDKTVQESTFLHSIFQFLNPNSELLEFLKSCNVNFSYSDDGQECVLDIAVKSRIDRNSIAWLLNNVDFTQKQLEKSFKDCVSSGNVNAFAAMVEGRYVTLNKIDTSAFLVNLIKNDVNYCEMARVLVRHELKLNVQTRSLESHFKELIKSLPGHTTDWWEIWDLFVSIIQTTTINMNVLKVRYIVIRTLYHRENSVDQILIHKLMECVKCIDNINDKDSNGNTFLHLLPWNKTNIYSYEIWKLLCDNGANPLQLNRQLAAPICKLLESYIELEWAICLKPIFHILNNIPSSDVTKISDVIILTVKPQKLKLIEKICHWYARNIDTSVASIRGKYKGKHVTILDMALLSYDGNVLEYLLKTYDCKEALLPFGGDWINNCVEQAKPDIQHLKFISLVNKLYPNSVNAPNMNGLVPLSMKNIHPYFVSYLVRLGANIEAFDKIGNTPLICALKHSNYYVIEALVKSGADVNTTLRNQITPLMLSLTTNDPAVMKRIFKLLIENKADPYKEDFKGNTVLHHMPLKVSPEDFHEIVEYILQKGFVELFYHPNKNGRTPIEIAEKRFEPFFEEFDFAKTFDLIHDYHNGKLSTKNNKRQSN